MLRVPVAVGIALLSIQPVYAQVDDLPAKANLATLNCRSVFEMKRISTVMIMAWLQRHYAAQDAAPILDSEKLIWDTLKLNEYCEAHPAKSVLDAANEAFGTRR